MALNDQTWFLLKSQGSIVNRVSPQGETVNAILLAAAQIVAADLRVEGRRR